MQPLVYVYSPKLSFTKKCYQALYSHRVPGDRTGTHSLIKSIHICGVYPLSYRLFKC